MTSKLIVNSIRHTGASADAITMDASGNVTFPANATCSGTATGFGGGKVLQVVSHDLSSTFTTTATSTTDVTGFSKAITPTAASSKIKVTFSFDYDIEENGDANVLGFVYFARQVASGSFSKIAGQALGARNVGAGNEYNGTSIIHLDSPTYTLGNAITYKLQCENYSSGSTISITQNTGVPRTSQVILEEIGA
tara:strand:- start:240 stop:821 length:582 start_codon:yes stop_codon:yes gene_type:complete